MVNSGQYGRRRAGPGEEYLLPACSRSGVVPMPDAETRGTAPPTVGAPALADPAALRELVTGQPDPGPRGRPGRLRPRQHPPPHPARSLHHLALARSRAGDGRRPAALRPGRRAGRRQRPRAPYAERSIHGAIYEARPEVTGGLPQPRAVGHPVLGDRRAAAPDLPRGRLDRRRDPGLGHRRRVRRDRHAGPERRAGALAGAGARARGGWR